MSRFVVMETVEVQMNKFLLKAAEHGIMTAVMRLLESGANLHSYDNDLRTPLHLACLNGHSNVAHFLVLKMGADIREMDANRMQPLHIAAKHGFDSLVGLLINNGADVEAEDKDGFTPIHWAASGGNEAAVQQLLDKGASITRKTRNGDLPVRIARRSRRLRIMKMLQDQVSEAQKVRVCLSYIFVVSNKKSTASISNR